MSVINIYTDGGARGNPGPAGAGYVISINNKELHRGNKYLGIKTNNQAEYLALIEAVNWLLENRKNMDIAKVNFFLDSELVVRQVRGEYKVKNEGLKSLHKEVISKLSKFSVSYSITYVPREKNKIADQLVNKAVDDNS